jgi:hypothetical protein
MFWLMRCALAIGVLYWLSPLRAPEAGDARDWRALETRWRDGSERVRGLALDSAGREAALGALSALRRPPADRETGHAKP